jgi:hypothetical protein
MYTTQVSHVSHTNHTFFVIINNTYYQQADDIEDEIEQMCPE